MDKVAKKFFSRKKSKSNLKKEMVKPDSNKPLPHKETGHSTTRSWDSKPSAREEDYVNSMSDSVRERCIKLIEAVNLKGMTELEMIKVLSQLLATLINEMEDVNSMHKFQDACQFKNFSDLEKIKLYFTAKEKRYNDPLEQNYQEMHFKCEYRHPEMVEMVRKRIEEVLNDKNALPYSALLQTAFGGKSRMVYELAKTVPTIYINLGREGRYPSKTEESARFFEGLRIHRWSRESRLETSLLLAIQELTNFIENQNSQESDAEILEKVWHAQVSGETSFLNESMLESEQYVNDVRLRLYNGLPRQPEKGKLKVLLVIDEARLLGPYQSRKGFFDNFIGVLSKLRNTGMFTLFVDTTNEITDLLEEGKLMSLDLEDTNVNPPIYYFNTFDVFVEDQNVSTREVTHKDKLLSMGRPMWYGFRQCEYADVVELAKRMLVESTDTANGKLASIMCLYAIPLDDTMELASSLLASNMALPGYIAPSRTLIKVHYGSEPVLAHGAHKALENYSFVDLLDILNTSMMNDQVSTDNRVEIVARILIMWLVTERHSELYSHTTRGLNLLGVDDFLQSMHVSTELAIPNGMVHFSHWSEIDCDLSPHVLLKCFTRGTAIAYCDCGPVVDMVIPVFIDTEENQKVIESLNLEYSQLSHCEPLEEHIEKAIAQCFSFVAIQLSDDIDAEKSFIENEIEFFESFSAHPGVIMNIKMSGEEKADDVSELSNHTYIYRESVEAWHLGRDETERLKNQINYRIAPRPGIDNKESLDQQEEYLKHLELFN